MELEETIPPPATGVEEIIPPPATGVEEIIPPPATEVEKIRRQQKDVIIFKLMITIFMLAVHLDDDLEPVTEQYRKTRDKLLTASILELLMYSRFVYNPAFADWVFQFKLWFATFMGFEITCMLLFGN